MTQFDETYFIVILKTRFLFYYSERESERFCMNLEFYTSFCFKKKFQTFFIFLLFHWILSHKEISEIERRKKKSLSINSRSKYMRVRHESLQLSIFLYVQTKKSSHSSLLCPPNIEIHSR